MLYDTIIIGGGPSGLSAAVYAARKKMKTMLISGDIGGMTAQSGHIENYLGFDLISGPELVMKFQDHLMKYKEDVEIKMGVFVKDVIKKDKIFVVKTDSGEFETKTVIVATGKIPLKLNVPGEKEFTNKGVTYCATCDGPIFAGKDVAVVGGGNSAMDAIISLMPIAKHIYGLTINKEFMGDQIMLSKIKSANNVTLITEATTTGISGEQFVNSLSYKDAQGKINKLNVGGIFVEIGSTPSTDFVKNLIKLNNYKEIIVDPSTCTNVPGVFGAGDATIVPEKQIIVAAGEGCKAALSAFAYLNQGKVENDY